MEQTFTDVFQEWFELYQMDESDHPAYEPGYTNKQYWNDLQKVEDRLNKLLQMDKVDQMQFKQFNLKSGGRISINIEQIESVYESKVGLTSIILKNREQYVVFEDYETVLDILR